MTGVSLARIARPQGRRGEVAATVLTDFPEHLLELRRVFLSHGSSEPRVVEVRSCRLEPSRRVAVFHFEGSDSIDDAEKLVGFEVQVPIEERLPAPPGSYYISDLVGCDVFAPGATVPLGRVADVQPVGEQTPGTPLLVVETGQGELLIPLAMDICREIDLARRRIVAELPEGLAEMNRKPAVG